MNKKCVISHQNVKKVHPASPQNDQIILQHSNLSICLWNEPCHRWPLVLSNPIKSVLPRQVVQLGNILTAHSYYFTGWHVEITSKLLCYVVHWQRFCSQIRSICLEHQAIGWLKDRQQSFSTCILEKRTRDTE